MPIFATETNHPLSWLIKRYENPDFPAFYHDVVVMNDTAGSIQVGTVLGKVTASGKFKVSRLGAGDGSEVPSAIYIGTGDALGAPVPTTLPATTDTKVLALARGLVIVSSAALIFDATINDATKRATAIAALKNVGILVEAAI